MHQYRDLNSPMRDFFRHDIKDLIPKEEKSSKIQYKIKLRNEDGTLSKWIDCYASDYGFIDAAGNFYHRNKTVVRKAIL